MTKLTRAFLFGFILLSVFTRISAQELQLSAEDKKQMDPFEAHSLDRADKCFNEKQYSSATAGYDSFVLEFPRSRVLAYAVFRKARSIDLDNKRFAAIKAYDEVLDYFPNEVYYAAAALYHMGVCYYETGDPENAIKKWLEMVRDKAYRKHYLAASALNMLAENYIKQQAFDRAMSSYEQVVEDFRTANPNAAWNAMWKVVEYRMVTNSDEPKLRAFYVKALGFERTPSKDVPQDVLSYWPYWDFIRKQVRQYGERFQAQQSNQHDAFYKYWADAMQGRWPESDVFQIDLADFRFAYEKDMKKRAERLDAQFVKYQKPGDNERIIRWLNLFHNDRQKMNEYYEKLDVTQLGFAEIEKLVFALIDLKELNMAFNAFDKMSFRELDDKARTALMRRLWQPARAGFPVAAMERLSQSFADQALGSAELLRYFHWMRDAKNGVPIARNLTSSPEFASESYFKMGDLLQWSNQFEDAIKSYQQADNPPATLFQVAECHNRLGRLERAIESLTEIENFFPKDGPRAAYRKAQLYGAAGLRDRQISALRAVMRKYPGSAESRSTHEDLEKLGALIGGGLEAE